MIERYTLPEMGKIWSEENKFRSMLEVEILACEAQAELGKIPKEVLSKIKGATFNLSRIKEIEKRTHHDVIALLENLSEVVGNEARYIPMGLTSSDILDTSLAVRMRESGKLIQKRSSSLRMYS